MAGVRSTIDIKWGIPNKLGISHRTKVVIFDSVYKRAFQNRFYFLSVAHYTGQK